MASRDAAMPAARIQPSTSSLAARCSADRNTRVRPSGCSESAASASQRARMRTASTRIDAVTSTMPERGLALVHEGPHAFLLVVERERRMELAPLEQQAFG